MKKTIICILLFLIATVFLPQAEKKAFAGDAIHVSTGDFELVTRKKMGEKGEHEALYRINNKTGETWVLKEEDIGWVKIREQV